MVVTARLMLKLGKVVKLLFKLKVFGGNLIFEVSDGFFGFCAFFLDNLN